MLLPARCPICQAVGSAPCARCIAAFCAAGPPFPLSGWNGQPPVWCSAALLYAHGGRALVGALKFRSDRSALRWSVAALAQLLDPPAIDLLTWAPTAPSRARRRGADQAETLARGLGKRLRLPVQPLLRRIPGPPQANRRRDERRAGVAFLALRDHGALQSLRIVVVDDVVTTGATLAAACCTLLASGALSVSAVALARAERFRIEHPVAAA